MARAELDAAAHVEVVYALPHVQRIVRLPLPDTGLTVADAVQQSGLPSEFPELASFAQRTFAVYGVVRPPGHPLRAGDRVEILRPLRQDPRALRRERAAAAAGQRARRR